jgi:hypothetical protein
MRCIEAQHAHRIGAGDDHQAGASVGGGSHLLHGLVLVDDRLARHVAATLGIDLVL